MRSIRFFAAVLMIILTDPIAAQEAYPFRDQDKWFLVDSNFKKIGKKNYAFITPLWCSRFLVKNTKGFYGIATENSKLLIPIKYDKIEFYDGLYYCTLNKKLDYFDSACKQVKPTMFAGHCGGSHGILVNVNTYKANGKLGLIYYNYEKNKYDTLPAIYEQVSEYVTNIAIARLNGKWGIITETGETLASFRFDSIQVYPDCFIRGTCINIYTVGAYKGYSDEKGNIITQAKYLDAGFFSNKYALVMDNSKRWGYIDRKGREYFK